MALMSSMQQWLGASTKLIAIKVSKLIRCQQTFSCEK